MELIGLISACCWCSCQMAVHLMPGSTGFACSARPGCEQGQHVSGAEVLNGLQQAMS